MRSEVAMAGTPMPVRLTVVDSTGTQNGRRRAGVHADAR